MVTVSSSGLIPAARAQPGQPVPHLLGRPPGERDGQELPGGPAQLGDLVGDAVGQRPGLAGARPRDDQQRAAGRGRGPLVAVEAVEYRSGARRSRRHVTPAARAGARGGTPRSVRQNLLLSAEGRQGRHGEQRRRPVQFIRLEQPDGAVLAVVARVPDHLAPAQPGDALGEQRTAGPAQVIERDLAQDAQLRPQRGDQPAHLAGHLLALRPGGEDLADDLRQLDQAGETRRPGGPEAGRAVGQLRDPVQDADGQRLAAGRAPGVQRAGLLGSRRTPHLRCPSRWYLPSSGKNSIVPSRPRPVRRASAIAK